MSPDLFGQPYDAPLPPQPQAAWPPWFRGGTGPMRRNVMNGLHPLGLPLLADAAKRCSDCSHHFVWSRGRRWPKCDLRASRCRSSDCAGRWRACAMFQPRGEAPRRTIYAAD